MNENFLTLINRLPNYFEQLQKSAPIKLEALSSKEKLSGIYVFYEDNMPIYVGRTRNLKQRLRSHQSINNPNAASFVFLMACKTYGRKKPSYKKEGSRKALHADEEFRTKHFLPANQRLKKMQVRFIEINCPKEQHLFEMYVSITLGTEKYNSFKTT